MLPATNVDATGIVQWAARREAQGDLPKVVRRLVFGTLENVKRCEFRSGEGVQLGGWDGLTDVERGNTFVPDGISGWEMGTSQDIGTKANQDYENRRNDPCGLDPKLATFVFITPRRWKKKAEWVQEKGAEGVWREVRAYDADDLETWLENAPAVSNWFSVLLGLRPRGTIDLGSWWTDWATMTRPAVAPELVLAGRKSVRDKIHEWSRERASSLSLQAESRDEALAVFAASVIQLPDPEQEVLLSRSVVVNDEAALRQIATSPQSLILVPTFDDAQAIAYATRQGHRCVVGLGRSAGEVSRVLQIPRIAFKEAEDALVGAGVSKDEASRLATLARRSFVILRRKLAQIGAVEKPHFGARSKPDAETAVRNCRSSVTCTGDFLSVWPTRSQ